MDVWEVASLIVARYIYSLYICMRYNMKNLDTMVRAQCRVVFWLRECRE